MEFHPLANMGDVPWRDFSFNSLTDNLPQSFQSLTNINDMYLQNNQFTGTLDVLANLPLQNLNIENNHFTGWIPEQLKGINLKYLQNNQFTGTLDVLANLPLQNLNLAGNGFNGGLPYSISLMTSLRYLYLQKNQFTGTLDVLANLPLQNLNLAGNGFNGGLPYSISLMTSLRYLYLQNNQFTGTLDVLANLPLQNLNIENNHFTGWIPEQLKGINLNNLASNGFNGGLPYSISLMTSLRYLLFGLWYLQNNQFTGTLDVLANLTLQNLNLAGNGFNGGLPYSISLMTSLRYLYLQNNQFTGTFDVLANLPLQNLTTPILSEQGIQLILTKPSRLPYDDPHESVQSI
ncbi:UNVERIFIED_CONTAM: protein STRUBBELIG-RECEPTOR FAMILY 7 [Sesamum calycinum]|uniref:Protein STRUBBELIG-RECEPTOR FAMILY 7 n=1 Tax=Sesamum calycinum TaxID=2727403 RepID=A0AAW2JV37_9LAMI